MIKCQGDLSKKVIQNRKRNEKGRITFFGKVNYANCMLSFKAENTTFRIRLV